MLRSTVAFRADGGRAFGLGHIRRCNALADELKERGHSVMLVTSPQVDCKDATKYWSHSVSWLSASAPPEYSLNNKSVEREDAVATISAIQEVNPPVRWVVMDHYGLGIDWEDSLLSADYLVFSFDDLRDRPHSANIVASDTSSPLTFPSRRGSRILLGRDYAVVSTKDNVVHPEGNQNGTLRLLVSYGGEDATGETAKALVAIEALLRSGDLAGVIGDIDVVVGPMNRYVVQDMESVNVHYSPSTIDHLIASSDIVLTTGGNTLVEALAQRKVCIVTQTAHNQGYMVQELAKEQMITLLSPDSSGAGSVEQALRRSIAEFKPAMERMGSKVLFDGRGAMRLASAMLELR